MLGMGLALSFIPVSIFLKVGLLIGTLVIICAIDYYILRKVEFYKILTVGICLLISTGILYFITQVVYVLPASNSIGEDEKYALVTIALFIFSYLSFSGWHFKYLF